MGKITDWEDMFFYIIESMMIDARLEEEYGGEGEYVFLRDRTEGVEAVYGGAAGGEDAAERLGKGMYYTAVGVTEGYDFENMDREAAWAYERERGKIEAAGGIWDSGYIKGMLFDGDDEGDCIRYGFGNYIEPWQRGYGVKNYYEPGGGKNSFGYEDNIRDSVEEMAEKEKRYYEKADELLIGNTAGYGKETGEYSEEIFARMEWERKLFEEERSVMCREEVLKNHRKIGEVQTQAIINGAGEDVVFGDRDIKIEVTNTNNIQKEVDIDEAMEKIGDRLWEMMAKSADGLYW